MLLHGLSTTYRSLMKTNGKLAKSQWKEKPWVVCYEVLVNPVMKGQKALGRTECLVAHWVQCCCHWACAVLDFASAVLCVGHA